MSGKTIQWNQLKLKWWTAARSIAFAKNSSSKVEQILYELIFFVFVFSLIGFCWSERTKLPKRRYNGKKYQWKRSKKRKLKQSCYRSIRTIGRWSNYVITAAATIIELSIIIYILCPAYFHKIQCAIFGGVCIRSIHSSLSFAAYYSTMYIVQNVLWLYSL